MDEVLPGVRNPVKIVISPASAAQTGYLTLSTELNGLFWAVHPIKSSRLQVHSCRETSHGHPSLFSCFWYCACYPGKRVTHDQHLSSIVNNRQSSIVRMIQLSGSIRRRGCITSRGSAGTVILERVLLNALRTRVKKATAQPETVNSLRVGS